MKIFFSIAIIYAGFGAEFMLNRYLAKHIELDGFGDFRVAIGIASISAMLVIFGGQGAARKFIPRYLSLARFGDTKGFILYYVRLAFGLGIVAAVIMLGLSEIFGRVGLSHLRHEAMQAIILTPFIALSLFAGASTQSMQRTTAAIVPNELLKPFLFLCAVFLWLTIFPTVTEIQAIYIFVGVLAAIVVVQYAFLIRFLPFAWRPETPVYHAKEWHGVGIPLLSSALANAVLVRIDIFALELLHVSEKEVGVFALLIFIAALVWMNFRAVLNVLTPRVSPIAEDRDALQKLLNNASLILLGMNAVGLVILLGLSEEILGWFSSDLLAYKNWFYFVVIGAAVNSLLEIGSPFVRFCGQQKQAAKLASMVLLANLIVTPVAVWFFGLEGALVTLVCVRLFRGLGYVFLMRRHIGIRILGLV